MRKYRVTFTRRDGAESTEEVDVPAGDAAAARLREKYPDARIVAVQVVRFGVGVRARRRDETT